jgi:hypothetical protein
MAKYPGTDKYGTVFLKGDRVLYYPRGRHIVAGERAEQAWLRFTAEAFDESQYNGRW